MSREVMTVQEVADYLDLGIAKVYQLIERKQIPASKIGKQYRFLKDAINAWLQASIIMQDTEFLTLIQEMRTDFINAGYTQRDIDQAVAQVREKT